MNEREIKNYTKAVQRRLRMPRQVRARVMSDFTSAISARREAGERLEDILAELGSPKQAAAELNEQMKAYTYRKSPWRFAFLALAALGGLYLLGETASMALVYLMIGSEAASLGVIGGADGPTAIFVTTSVAAPTQEAKLLTALLLLVAGAFGYWRMKRCGPKDREQ